MSKLALKFSEAEDHDAHVESWQSQFEHDRKVEELELGEGEYVPLWLGDVEERVIPGVDGPPYPYEARCRNRVLTEREYAMECVRPASVAGTRGRMIAMVDVVTADEDFGKVIDGE